MPDHSSSESEFRKNRLTTEIQISSFYILDDLLIVIPVERGIPAQHNIHQDAAASHIAFEVVILK